MSKIFISHSSVNNAAALAIAKWLGDSGWEEYFLDITPTRGLAPGERWQAALKAAADRCEAVLFLISPAWLASRWCLAEFLLAKQLGKTIFGVLVEYTALESLPREMTAEWQLCDLVKGDERRIFRVSQEPIVADTEVTFAEDGLTRLRIGLQRAGLDPASFPWPPPSDPGRLPYRGLKALEAEDAAVFFGREAAIVRGLDALRGTSDRGIEQLFVILGASGAGKSSFVRAGLWPRLLRDDRHFLPLPVIRPERAVISGTTGLAASLERAYRVRGTARSRASVIEALNQPGGLERELAGLRALAVARLEPDSAAPVPIITIDQGEELFGPDGGPEAVRFLEMLALTLSPSVRQRPFAIVAIRSDAYEHLQAASQLALLVPYLFSLPPVSNTEFVAVVEGPARRHSEAGHRLSIDSTLTERLVRDTEGADALPLLAFTLERLFIEHGGGGKLSLGDYEAMGGVRGSIEAAVEAAFAEPGREPKVPADKRVRDGMLRAAFIPWLARVEPDNEQPKRRVVSWDDIPAEARPLLERLIEQRLLVRDRRRLEGRDDAVVVEVAHEALLRQWPLLTEWLREDALALQTLDAVQRAAAEWAKNRPLAGTGEAWLVHGGERLAAAEVLQRADFRRLLGATGASYLEACRAREDRERLEKQAHADAERVAKERELAQAKALAEAEHQRANAQAAARIRQRRLSVALLGLLIVALATAWYGKREGRLAEHQQKLAQSGELAADALNSLTQDPQRSLLLAIEGASLSYAADGAISNKIQYALHRILQATHARLTLPHPGNMAKAVAYSPDGRLVATANSLGIKLWDAVGGRELPTRFDGAGHVLGVAFTADGARLLTAGRNGLVGVWDVASGREVSMLRGHDGPVWSVLVSPDGGRIATAGNDKTARIWDLGTAQLLRTFTGHTEAVSAVAFSADGRLLATGSFDRSARIWDVATGVQLQRILVDGTVRGVAFSAEGRRLATVDTGATSVKFWDVASGQALESWDGHTASVFAVAYSPDGKQLATVSLDKTAKLWSVATGKELFSLTGHTSSVLCLAFSPNGKRLITGSEDGSARIWDISSFAELPSLTGHTGNIHQVVYSPDGKRLATASDDTTARIWDARNGRELMVLAQHHAPVNGVAFSPDGKRLATAGADHSAKIFDLASGRELFTLLGHQAPVNSIAFSKDGRRLATGSSDKTAKIWDPATGRELKTVSASDGTVSGVDLNADGSRVALAINLQGVAGGATAQLWDWASQKQLLRLDGDYVEVSQIAFSNDGKQLATAGSSPPFALKIWDALSGREISALFGHPGGILTVAFSRDGSRLATGGYYETAKVWDASSGRELLDLPGNVGTVFSVAFSPDGKRVATAGNNRKVRIYAADPEDLLRLARSRLTRALTPEECRLYLRRPDCSGSSTSQIVAGIGLLKSGHADAAFGTFRTALRNDDIGDAEADAKKLMATLLAEQGAERADVADLAGARRDFQAADALDPSPGDNSAQEAAALVAAAQVQIAYRLGNKQEWAAAVDLLQTAIGLDPNDEEAYRALSWVYNNTDQQDKAVAAMSKVLETHPTPSNLMALAEGFRLKQDYGQAAKMLAKAVSLDPENARAHAELGRALRENNQLDLAIQEFSTAIAIAPTKWDYVELARVYDQRRQFPLAIESFDKAKAIDSEYAYAYEQAGLMYEMDMLDYQSAYKEMKKARSLLPEDSSDAANFAEACLTSGHWEDAVHTADMLLSSTSNSSDVTVSDRLSLRFMSVAALLLQGKRTEAQAARGTLEAYMRTLSKFHQGWDYSATRTYLVKHPMPGADRALLLKLLDTIEKLPAGGSS